MSNRLGGKQGTAYLGTNADQPPNVTYNNRSPTPYDINYSLMDFWFDNSVTGVNRVWVLVSLEGNSNSKGPVAQWVQFGTGELATLTGNSGGTVSGDSLRNINVVGTGNILVTGDPVAHSLSISLNPSSFGACISENVPDVTGDGTIYTIIFDTVFSNVGNNYNPSTGIYTAPANGLYNFSSTVTLYNFSSKMTVGAWNFIVQGTGPSVGVWAAQRLNPYVVMDAESGFWRSNGSVSVLLNASDTVLVNTTVFNGDSATAGINIGFSGSPTTTWFTGARIY